MKEDRYTTRKIRIELATRHSNHMSRAMPEANAVTCCSVDTVSIHAPDALPS